LAFSGAYNGTQLAWFLRFPPSNDGDAGIKFLNDFNNLQIVFGCASVWHDGRIYEGDNGTKRLAGRRNTKP
jgi:hypothetical protein